MCVCVCVCACACVCVCACMCVCRRGRKEKRGWEGGGVLLRLSISRDQLMASDDGAERGQGSKPLHCQPSPHSPIGFPPSLAPPHPTPTLPFLLHPSIPPAHLHTFINSVRSRGGCTACITGWLPLQSAPAVAAVHAFAANAISVSILYCVQALVHDP